MSEQPTYAILIEPELQQVSLVPVEGQVRFKQFYEVLDCSIIEIVQLRQGVDMLCNEEGYFVDGNPIFYIDIDDERVFHQIVGKTTIVKNTGSDLFGFTIPEIEELVSQIKVKWSKK